MNQDWVMEQSQTTHHKMAIYLFPLVIFFGYLHPVLFGIGLVVFFLVTSFKMLKSMLFWMLLLGGVSFVIPFLAPIIFIIMIIFFILRIGYVVKNWRPFISGILLYGVSAGLIYRSVYLSTYSFLSVSTIIEGAIVSILGFALLRLMLCKLYQFNYTSYAALGIMGSAPVIIIAFILPFLKLHIGGDFFTAETNSVSAEAAYTHTKLGTGEPVEANMTLTHEKPLIHVKEHIRTAPDGDLTNNFSYDGLDKKVSNSEVVEVRGYVRTVPDGDPMNNLSYFDKGLLYSSDSQSHMDKASIVKSHDIIPPNLEGKIKELESTDFTRKSRRGLNKLQKQELLGDKKIRTTALLMMGLLGLLVGAYFIVDTIKNSEISLHNPVEAKRGDELIESSKEADTITKGIGASTSISERLYRVQAGTFSSNTNALALRSDIQAHGFKTTIKKTESFI